MLFTLVIFLIWRIIDLTVSFFAPQFIPYLGFFSYQKDLAAVNLPQFIKSFANFDGLFYLRIAEKGYSQFEHAFFPLYPLLIKYMSYIFNNKLIIGLLISNISFIFALFFLKKYLNDLFKDNKLSNWIITLLFVFPTSFFFGSLYTESLFLLFTVLTFYSLHKKHFFIASIFSILSSLTRFVGVFLFVPILIYVICENWKTIFKKIKAVLYVISPFIGLGIYSTFLYFTTGNFIEFFTSQEAFSAGRSTKIILFPQVIYRYIKIFITADYNFQYFISSIEFLIFILFFLVISIQLYLIIKKKNKNIALLSLTIFSLINIILPTFTGTFLSIPRFALLSLSFFIFIGLLKSNFIKTLIALIFLILH
ncbi:MAG: mannosyltransferase family protein, partial [bacterium]|nr:mannosyltransferase family protein [bacterium]